MRGLKPHQLPVTAQSKEELWNYLADKAAACQACPEIAARRLNVVCGVGNLEAQLMLVGEAPGLKEDAAGQPFVGNAGALVAKMLAVIGLKREDTYITNALKCRPDTPRGESGNRPPTLTEMRTCAPFVLAELEIVKPKTVLALGSTAYTVLLHGQPKVERGFVYNLGDVTVVTTYHPSYVLRNPTQDVRRQFVDHWLTAAEHAGYTLTDDALDFQLTEADLL